MVVGDEDARSVHALYLRIVPVSAKLVYAGTDIGAADAALPVRDRLLICSGLDAKILSCALPG